MNIVGKNPLQVRRHRMTAGARAVLHNVNMILDGGEPEMLSRFYCIAPVV